jgi:HPt (histidine-containing phosphotransfer) domain-containing protein
MTDTQDVLDRDRLESLVEEIGDRVLVRQAVQAFLDEVPDRLATIRIALSGEPEELRSAAHALGSPASMLGGVEVTRLACALQAAALESAPGTCRALAEELESATQRTAAAMRAYLAAPVAGEGFATSTPAPDPSRWSDGSR